MTIRILNSSTQSLTCVYPAGLTPPWSWAYLIRPQSVTDSTTCAMSFSVNATAGEFHAAMLHGTAAGTGSGFAARSATAGTDKQSFKSQSLATTDAYAIACVHAADNDRVVYINGVAGTANTNTLAPAVDRFDIGARFDGGTHTEGVTANIYMPTVWNIALTADEVAAWFTDLSGAGDGPWPLFTLLHPESIVWHSEFGRRSSTSATFYDRFGGTAITPVNAPAIGVTVPMRRPVPTWG